MTKKLDNPAEALGLADDEPGGWMSNVLAEEDELDRRALWRLGSWGVGTVGAVIVGILATQSPVAIQREQLAAAEMQTKQVQWIAKESQNQARQLAAAVDTLNGDRDRLYARVTVLEENLESVTGSIAKQKAIANLPPIIAAPQAAAPDIATATVTVPPDTKQQAAPQLTPPPKIAPVASIPSPAPVEQKAAAAEPAKKETTVTGALTTDAAASNNAIADKPVQQTAFGVELGGANSVEGLRAVWRTVNKSNGAIFGALQPIVVMKEGNDGLGMKLRLVAGPLNDAAAAAKICAILIADKRSCLPSVYDGQRLAMQDEKKPDAKPVAPKKRAQGQSVPASGGSSFSSIFGFR
ncbi:MAG: hypothetical protein NTZ72_10205 [Afipia sp.]|nr:hypothetical protein [Afipia sp.]